MSKTLQRFDATNIERLRKERNLTKRELARKAKMNLRTYNRIVAGRFPFIFELIQIANALNVEIVELLKEIKYFTV